MLVEGIIMGLVIGKLRGGRLKNIGILQMKAWPLVILAILLQGITLFSNDVELIYRLSNMCYGFSLVLLGIMFSMNTHEKGIWIIMVGILLNLLAMLINGGKMPIHISDLNALGQNLFYENGDSIRYIGFEEARWFSGYLGQMILIPKPYPLAKLISIGDILMGAGLIYFVQEAMMRSLFGLGESRMIKIPYNWK